MPALSFVCELGVSRVRATSALPVVLAFFGATRTIVLVNLRTLECSPVTCNGLPEGEQMQM